MRKPAICIFCGLCILTSFSLLTVNVPGVSNKHCLLPFFSFSQAIYFLDFCKKEKILKTNGCLNFCKYKKANINGHKNVGLR